MGQAVAAEAEPEQPTKEASHEEADNTRTGQREAWADSGRADGCSLPLVADGERLARPVAEAGKPALAGGLAACPLGGNQPEGKPVALQGADVDEPPPVVAEEVGGNTVALKRAKTPKPRSRKVLDFSALKRAKQSNEKGQPHLPSRGQTDTEWLKSLLPDPKPGAWWEAPADDKGFRIKLRWRAGGKKPAYPFARLGKRELEQLREKTYDEQKRALSGRIFRELYRRGDRAIAARIAPYVGSGENVGNLSA